MVRDAVWTKKGMPYILLLFPVFAWAMPIKSQMLKPRAYFVEAENNLLEPLDLKSKSLKFVKTDFEQCGTNLVRKALTLDYSCTLPIPSRARISRLQNVVTPMKIDVNFGGSKRVVQIAVAPDARSVTASTAFDKTGIDFEVLKFNDDVFTLFNKDAQLVIADALAHQPLRIEVLESR